MKRRRHFLGRHDSHVVRQTGVERAHEDIGGEDAAQREAGHLPEGVDAGIGPARAGHGHFVLVELAQRVLEQSLNGGAGGLPLPADKAAAVIRDGDLEGWHCESGSQTSVSARPACILPLA